MTMKVTILSEHPDFKWRGTNHPINALPVVHSNDGFVLNAEEMAGYVLKHRKRRKPRKGQGQCAHYVCKAFKASGLQVPNCPYSACQYVHHLPEWGFELVASGICHRYPEGYVARLGDVCVLAASHESHHGHICVFTHKGWCSDYIYPTGMNPYKGDCQYAIFRWRGQQHTCIERYRELTLYYPQYDTLEFRCACQLPSPLDNTVTMALSPAFTWNYRLKATRRRIVGLSVADGIFCDSWKEGIYGTFVYCNGRHTFLDSHIDRQQLSTQLLEVAKQKGLAFQQLYWIYDYKPRQIHYRHPTKKYHFRVLSDFGGRLCMIEATKKMLSQNFMEQLQELHIQTAMNLDTSTGWQNSWYRDEKSRVHFIHFAPFPFASNFLLFLSHNKQS